MAELADRPGGAPLAKQAFWDECLALLRLSSPLIGAQLAQMAMGVVGTLVAGRLGVAVLAAQALGATVFVLVLITALGMMAGLDPHVARSIGARQFSQAGMQFRQGWWLVAVAGVPLTALLWLAPAALLAMGQDPRLVADTRQYLDWTAVGLLPALGYALCRSFASAVGNAGAVMVIAVAGNVIHALLACWLALPDYGGMGMGLRGLGIATAACRLLMCLALLAWVLWAPAFAHVRARFAMPNRELLLPMLRTGLPLGVQYGLEVTGFVLTTLWMGLLGDKVLAAHEVALSTAAIAFQVPFSIGTAAAMRVGRAVGRGDPAAVRLAGWCAFAVGTAYAFAAAAALATLRHPIARAYLPDGGETVLTLAEHLLVIAAAFQLFDGVQAIGFGVLRGLDDTRMPMLLNVLGFGLLGLPFGYVSVFVLHRGPDRLWWGLTLALGVVAVGLVARFGWWTRRMGTDAAVAGA